MTLLGTLLALTGFKGKPLNVLNDWPGDELDLCQVGLLSRSSENPLDKMDTIGSTSGVGPQV